MSTSSSSYHDYIMTDILGSFSGLSSRAMFGGYGIYQDDIFFALIADDQLYFKVDAKTLPHYQELGSEQFIHMPYWLVPEQILNNRQELGEWIEQAVRVARATKKPKRKVKKS